MRFIHFGRPPKERLIRRFNEAPFILQVRKNTSEAWTLQQSLKVLIILLFLASLFLLFKLIRPL